MAQRHGSRIVLQAGFAVRTVAIAVLAVAFLWGISGAPMALFGRRFVGLNLRPFITGVGPLAEGIRDQTGLGLQGLSLLTLVPMLLMGLVAFAGPTLQSTMGARRSITAGLALLCAGSLLRLYSVTGWELIGTPAVIGCGVAIVQAMFPGVVKRMFPGHVAKVMGLYSAMLMCGGALGAKVSPTVAGWTGDWHLGLAWRALPAGLAVLLAALCLPASGRSASGGNVTTVLLRRPRAWLLMLCFGLVNGGYSTVIAWLSPSYQAQGWSGTASGSLLAVMAASQAVSALVLPLFMGREGDRPRVAMADARASSGGLHGARLLATTRALHLDRIGRSRIGRMLRVVDGGGARPAVRSGPCRRAVGPHAGRRLPDRRHPTMDRRRAA